MKKSLGASFILAAIALVAFAQSHQDPASLMAARKEAMNAFSAMDGVWRGPAWMILPTGAKVSMTQTERIGSFLDGTVKVVEGRGYFENGDVGFNALGIISYDPATKSYAMLCGFALGSGFGLFEDALRGATDYPHAVSPRILGIPVFLDSYREFIGHGGTTAFVGLALGWAIWCSRRKALLALGPLLVAAVLWWMMVDHALVNFAHNASVEWPRVVRWTWTLTGGGAFAPYVLFGALLATMAAEKVAVWRVTVRLPRLPARDAASLAVEPLRRGIGYGSLRAALRRVKRLALYVLARRQIGFLMLHARGDRPADAPGIRRLLRMRIAEVCAVRTAARGR